MSGRLRRAFDKARRRSEDREIVRGLMGKPDGDGTYTVRVSERPGWAYVSLGPEGNQGVAIAFNYGVPYRAGLPVKLKRMDQLGNLLIIGTDEFRFDHYSGGSGNTFSVGPHTHAIGSGLEYEVEGLRLEPGRLRYFSGMEVYINAFRYLDNTDSPEYWPGGAIDLTSNQPSNTGNWAWVLVGVDRSDNTAIAVAGTEYSYTTPLTPDLLDDIDFSGYEPCGAIKVREDDTALNNLDRYLDAHLWFGGLIAGADEKVKVSSNDTTEDYLIDKLAAGAAIGITETDDGGNETATLAVDLTNLSEEITIDGVNDEALFYDNDAAVHRKVPPWRFQSSSRMIYAQTADNEIVNTTDETRLFGRGAGTLTIPANSLIVGSVIRIHAFGKISDTGTPTGTIKITLGGTTIATTGPTLTTISGVEWLFDGWISIRTLGAAGTAQGGGLFDYDEGTEEMLISASDVTIDTTGSLAVDLTWTWGAASASNTIESRISQIEILNPPPGSVAAGGALLLETGDYLLLETGDKILLE